MAGAMIVATAGHVDHGKSALIQALTGREMDRAPEARRRGMTIDLGFAPAPLPGGAVAELIDVPGHESLVRTMVAGASGADAALLVVSADEGIMPQTVEHLSVLEHLGIARGIPVVTKCDLVTPDWLSLVVSELESRLRGSSVVFTPAIPVSVRDGRGLVALREAMHALAHQVVERPVDDLFRLPVDRVMTIGGAGTVVAGVCWSGSIELGAMVRLAPGDVLARVRSIESQGVATPSARGGRRIALALAGIERSSLRRGTTLVGADADWPAMRRFDAMLTLGPVARRLDRRTRVHVLIGTDDVMGWVAPRQTLGPADSGLARLWLDRPILARGRDRFVVRRAGEGTVAGGEVLDIEPARGSRWPGTLSSPQMNERFHALVERRPAGIRLAELPVISGLSPGAVTREVRQHDQLERVGERVITVAQLELAAETLANALERYHAAHPAEQGMPLETLRRSNRFHPSIAEAALVRLRSRGALEISNDIVRLPGFRPRVSGGDAVVRQFVDRIEAAGLTPPSVTELAVVTGRSDAATILRFAAGEGRIEAVERDRYFARTALDAFLRAVADEAAEGLVSIPRLRDRLGISRKFLIPLLEWSDRKGYTLRNGDTRRVRAAVVGPARSE